FVTFIQYGMKYFDEGVPTEVSAETASVPDQETSLRDRVSLLDEYLLAYYREVSQMAQQEYPEQVHLSSNGIAVLKQREDYHSFSVLAHGKIAYGVASFVYDFNLPGRDKTSTEDRAYTFFTPSVGQTFVTQILESSQEDEESSIRREVL